MYLFLLFGPAFAFILLVLLVYPSEELGETRRAALRGILAAIPIWIVAGFLGSLVPPLYGSFLLGFHEWALRFLPYAFLPAAAYLVFYRLAEPLRPGAKARRLTAFYAGALCPLGLGEMVRIWGSPDAYELFVLPILLCALVLAMPRIIMELEDSYGARRFALILGSLAATFAASCGLWLFLLRVWPFAWLLAAILALGAWALARADLLKRAPSAIAE